MRKPFLGHTNHGNFIKNTTVWKHMPTSGIGTVFNLPSSDMLRDQYLQLKPRNAGTYSRANTMLAMLIQFETFTCTRKTSGASTGLKPAGAPCRYGLFSLLKIPILRIHVRTPENKIKDWTAPRFARRNPLAPLPAAEEKLCARKKSRLSQVRRAWPKP